MNQRSGVFLAVFTLVTGAGGGCGSDSSALIQQTSPLNGATSIDLTVKPTITMIKTAAIDLYPVNSQKVVLYDVTGGAKQVVKGSVLAEGSTITYEPEASELTQGHEYRLVMKKEFCEGSPRQCRPTVADDEATETDGSEWPEERLAWPYTLSFSTGSAPRVRAAYLDGNQLHVRFSQKMNSVVTQGQVEVTDIGSVTVQLTQPTWTDEQRSLRFDIQGALEATGIYTLKVGRLATAEDGTLFDGDGDGQPGETDDYWSIKFTGSQSVIRSRLKPDEK